MIIVTKFWLLQQILESGDGEMGKICSKNRIIMYVCVFITTCMVFLLSGRSLSASAKTIEVYHNHVIFTAPSAVKVYDGTPLTEQIDVTAQGLPEGFTYKAVAEGSVTYPEDNTEDNNVVTDYRIYDPSGLNVTDKFVNVELRPGTLEVTYGESDVLGARREDSDEIEYVYGDETVEIEDEDTALSGKLEYVKGLVDVEIIIYFTLIIMMLAAFVAFIADSRKSRER